jgi:hypothetical protein
MPLQLLEASSLYASKTEPVLLQQRSLTQLQDVQVVIEEPLLVSQIAVYARLLLQ